MASYYPFRAENDRGQTGSKTCFLCTVGRMLEAGERDTLPFLANLVLPAPSLLQILALALRADGLEQGGGR